VTLPEFFVDVWPFGLAVLPLLFMFWGCSLIVGLGLYFWPLVLFILSEFVFQTVFLPGVYFGCWSMKDFIPRKKKKKVSFLLLHSLNCILFIVVFVFRFNFGGIIFSRNKVLFIIMSLVNLVTLPVHLKKEKKKKKKLPSQVDMHIPIGLPAKVWSLILFASMNTNAEKCAGCHISHE